MIRRKVIFILTLCAIICVQMHGYADDAYVIELTETTDDSSKDKQDPDHRGKRTLPLVCEITRNGINVCIDKGEIVNYILLNVETNSIIGCYNDDVLCVEYIFASQKPLLLRIEYNDASYEGIIMIN